MGLRKNDQDLRALINKGIAAVQADGTYGQIQKKYFGDQDIYHE
jgi:histidine transport system substrate-binding protein